MLQWRRRRTAASGEGEEECAARTRSWTTRCV